MVRTLCAPSAVMTTRYPIEAAGLITTRAERRLRKLLPTRTAA